MAIFAHGFTQETQELILDTLQTLTARSDMLEIEQELLKNKFSALQRRAEWQENHARRLNLLFFGIPRAASETPEECEAKVAEVIRRDLGVEERDVRADHAHRLVQGGVVVRFLSVRDKMRVLSRAGRLRGTAVRVSEDFSPRVRALRQGLAGLRATYVSEGKRAVLRFDKLYTDFDVFTFDLHTRTVVKVSRQPQPADPPPPAPQLPSNLQRWHAARQLHHRQQQQRRHQQQQQQWERGSLGSGGSLSE